MGQLTSNTGSDSEVTHVEMYETRTFDLGAFTDTEPDTNTSCFAALRPARFSYFSFERKTKQWADFSFSRCYLSHWLRLSVFELEQSTPNLKVTFAQASWQTASSLPPESLPCHTVHYTKWEFTPSMSSKHFVPFANEHNQNPFFIFWQK